MLGTLLACMFAFVVGLCRFRFPSCLQECVVLGIIYNACNAKILVLKIICDATVRVTSCTCCFCVYCGLFKKKNVLPLYLVVVTSCDKKYNFEVSCWDMIGHLGCG